MEGEEAPLFMTHYEATQIVALRASLLSDGALAKVDVDPAAPFDSVLVAATELLEGRVDCVVEREGRDVHVSRFELPAGLRNFVRLRAETHVAPDARVRADAPKTLAPGKGP